MRLKVIKIYAWVLTFGILYIIWTTATGLYIPCFYMETTGLKCPGCGLTHMFLSLARLDFKSAFFHNPVLFVLLIFWNIIGVLYIAKVPERILTLRFIRTSAILSLMSAIIYGIVRNF